jgi:FkbM family methyltransferase
MYSQNREEEVVKAFFDANYPSIKGVVLDIGANDGKTLSNSFAFINERGWRGYLIEAGKTPYSHLENLYRGNNDVRIFNVALGDIDGEMNFHESGNLLGVGDSGLVSSLVPSETNRWKQSGVPYTEYTVQCLTWESFYKKCCANMTFDFISIDIEGMDYVVLSQINLSAYGCKCLCVEWNGKEKQKYIDYASLHGLNLIHENAENLIFGKTGVK